MRLMYTCRKFQRNSMIKKQQQQRTFLMKMNKNKKQNKMQKFQLHKGWVKKKAKTIASISYHTKIYYRKYFSYTIHIHTYYILIHTIQMNFIDLIFTTFKMSAISEMKHSNFHTLWNGYLNKWLWNANMSINSRKYLLRK